MKDYSELQEIVRAAKLVRVAGASTFRQTDIESEATVIDLSPYNQIIEASKDDQTMTVQVGFNNDGVRPNEFSGCYVPYPVFIPSFDFDAIGFSHTVGELLSIDVQHPRSHLDGNWRDFVLGMKLMLPDGTIVSSGGKTNKSVAGFDLHKLIIGSRFTLAIPLEVTLRLATTQETKGVGWGEGIERYSKLADSKRAIPVVQKVDAREFEISVREFDGDLVAGVPQEGLLWGNVGVPSEAPSRGFVQVADRLGTVRGISPQTKALMRRTKQLFDPTNKLNPGEFGFI